jgi:ribonuclease HI
MAETGYLPRTTNNIAELEAAVQALLVLDADLLRKQGQSVILTTDSAYLKNGITDWVWGWQRRRWRTRTGAPVANVNLWKRLMAVLDDLKGVFVQFKHVPGHRGHTENEAADFFAKTARTNRCGLSLREARSLAELYAWSGLTPKGEHHGFRRRDGLQGARESCCPRP